MSLPPPQDNPSGAGPGPSDFGDVNLSSPAPPGPGAQSATLYQIGDVAVTANTIVTPNGEVPLGGSTWIASDQTRTEESIPAYAIVLAIVFFLACLLGLLFLLIKERKTSGYVEVRIRSGDFVHMTQVPASSASHVDKIRAYVAEIQAHASRSRG